MKRYTGVLLSVTSLPSKYGIGCFDQSAYDFVDWLEKSGQRYWQILPLGATSHGGSDDSPYQAFSAFAGNPYFISLDALVEEGVLSREECDAVDFGTDPYSYMNFSISEKFGWSLGNWQLICNILLFIPVLLWGRDQIGLGTLFNMIFVGYTVDGTMWLLELAGFPALMENPAARWITMILALIGFIFSAATYMASGMGSSPFDALSIMIAHKLPKLPFTVVRLVYDTVITVIGLLFGGKLGIVTILMVLFLGLAVDLVAKKVFKRKM